jgi:L-cysteine:1D-myo-inositol 2-amino-2-deoxy-alpha-D-glucopyranoside ligase
MTRIIPAKGGPDTLLKLYNEQTRKIETFTPLGDTATIYVCGITPYDTTHLGHAFTYLSFDVLIRYWEYLGHPVRYVQNVTDIDDDTLRKGKEVGENWRDLGNRWTRHFMADMCDLNVRPPDVYPRATDVIPDMFPFIQTLMDKGHAYEANGNVYFSVASYSDFGKVSGLSQREWLPTANERGNFPDDPNKRDPLDFVLWQAQQPDEPAWESPWGMGRPGWHIECSTMAVKYLGETIDVHGGGGDLSFPHHECETAQTCSMTGQPFFARFWMHAAMVRYQGEKMSKSLGNLIWARDLLQDYTADAVRILIHNHPYHESWEYDASELEPAAGMANVLLCGVQVQGGQGPTMDPSAAVGAFEEAMNDNLNTPEALAVLTELAGRIAAAAAGGHDVARAQAALRRMGGVFGLRFDGDVEPRVRAGWTVHMSRFE